MISAIPEMNGVFLALGVLRKLSDMPRTTDKGGGGTDSSEGTLMYNSITGRDIRTHTEPYSRGTSEGRRGGSSSWPFSSPPDRYEADGIVRTRK